MQTVLGHASIVMTHDRYGNLFEDRDGDVEAMKKLEAADRDKIATNEPNPKQFNAGRHHSKLIVSTSLYARKRASAKWRRRVRQKPCQWERWSHYCCLKAAIIPWWPVALPLGAYVNALATGFRAMPATTLLLVVKGAHENQPGLVSFGTVSARIIPMNKSPAAVGAFEITDSEPVLVFVAALSSGFEVERMPVA